MGLNARSGSLCPLLEPLLKQALAGNAGQAQEKPVKTLARPEMSAGP